MNPPLPTPNQTFSNFHLPIPNPNPNSNSFSNPDFPHFESQDPPLDLSSSLSSLKNLIHVANQTLQSLSHLSLTQNHEFEFLHCGFDRRHRVPPHSLFRHSLLCPSAPLPRIDPTQLLHSSLYPQTLRPSSQLVNEKRFHQPLPDSEADLCFSLNDYVDGSSNFFYLNCPGVVSLPNLDEMSKFFTLPRVLAVECVNFVGDDDDNDDDDDRETKNGFKGIRILPSELWALRSEVEMWNEYPNMYSRIVLRSILGSEVATDSRLTTWIIANSPRYGVIIDVAMRDHIFLLFRLCFMAISKEALRFRIELENGNGMEGGLEKNSFKCPTLIQVLMWLASQLSVLYGETNAKLFAVNMLRQCILDAALGLLLLSSEQKQPESQTFEDGSHSLESNRGDTQSVKLRELGDEVKTNGNLIGEETVSCRVIFVSQVAAAIAALHERFLLEEKIKALRFSHLQTKYQLVSEHIYINQRACEERKRRCNYRPIIEHDGLPKQQYHDEDTNKTKTREELLAEERDYKRRRMSYRGKKVKRSSLEVTRDIIEEYMEEIMKAGGIGCFVKGPDERETKFEQSTEHNITRDVIADEHRKGSTDSYGSARYSSHHSKQQSNNGSRYLASDKPPKGHYGHNGSPEGERKSVRKDKYDRDRSRRLSDERSSLSQSHKGKRYVSDQDDEVLDHHESRSSSNFHGFRSSSLSRSGGGSRKDGHKSRASDNWKRSTTDYHSSESSELNSFSDRYTPSKCHDQLEDDYSTGSRYVDPDEL